MSGIFGLFYRDGRPVQESVLLSMARGMTSWRADGCRPWHRGPVGLGRLPLYGDVDPEKGGQPFQSAESGVVVTASARLDNREELGRTLGYSPVETGGLDDDKLILKAYARWGRDCVNHLLGDWSFGLWDSRNKRMLLARDHCGISGVYYYEDEHLFAFASCLKGLFALPGVRRRPNQMRLVRLITAWVEGIDFGETFHQDVRRLAPAHRLWVEPERSRLEEYWSLDDVPEIRFTRTEDYLEAFLERYRAAVGSRLRTEREVGILFSSGLDSGSVAALAAPELAARSRSLQAFTSVPLQEARAFGPLADEGPVAESTAHYIGNIKLHRVRAEDISPLQGALQVLELLQEPGHAAANFYWLLATLRAARDRDVGVLLTGQFGNLTVSWSDYRNHLRSLLRRGRIFPYAQEIKAWRNIQQAGPAQTIRKQVLPTAIPLWLLKLVNRVRLRHTGTLLLLNPDLARRLRLEEKMRATGHDPAQAETDNRVLRRLMVLHSLPRATLYEMGAAHGLEVRDPTVDRRVLEFCLGAPDEVFHGQGRDRLLIRRSFEGLLPPDVLRTSARGVQAADVMQRLVADVHDLERMLADLEACPLCAGWLDLPRLRRMVGEIESSAGDSRLVPNVLLKGFMVGAFLKELAESGSSDGEIELS